MTDRVHARLLILAVLVMSLIATLAARAFSLQVPGADAARAAAEGNRVRELVIPAARGLILDRAGRPLAVNRIGLDVAIDRRALRRLDDDGAQVLDRLGGVLGMNPARVAARLQNCGTPGARPQPNCWNGAPGASPVVARDVDIETAGRVLGDPGSFPAVSVQRVPVREYPGRTLAAHALGHVGSVTAEDLAQDPQLDGIVVRGRAGLELQHDAALRGRPGRERVVVDSSGLRSSGAVDVEAVPGQSLVTTIDAELQAVVEQQLEAAIERGRGRIDPVSGRPYEADGGAAVVLDVRTGAVLALASAPDFDVNVWTGGISSEDYAELIDPEAGEPLLNRAVQTALAPASTFKAFSTLAALAAGYSTSATYPCPAVYRAGGRPFRNYRSRELGDITLNRALEASCDTIFFRLAHEQWEADGGAAPRGDPDDLVTTIAADFGFGARTGIDLPGESSGMLASREAKQARWDQRHDVWCARAENGYPELTDRQRADYLQQLAQENCANGMDWRVGDALNAAIGQGDTAATVLQVATAYAAIANGGTVLRPQLARALLDPDGSVAREFAAQPQRSVAVPAAQLAFLRRALQGVIDQGTAQRAFAGFPLAEVPLAGKTGTGEVFGKQATSWFASFAPADDPRYAVVIMVSQGGTGAGTSGRSVKAIYEALFGVVDGQADPARSVLIGSDTADEVPAVGPDGVPAPVPPSGWTRAMAALEQDGAAVDGRAASAGGGSP